MTNADSQDKADRQKTSRLAAIRLKEAIAAAIISILGAQITNPILRTTDGLDFRTVDVYELHQLISAVKEGYERPSSIDIKQMMVDVMTKKFNWRESAVTNLEQISTAIAKAATYGLRFHKDMKRLAITANVAHVVHQRWGSELTEAQLNIKAKYLYNKVYDADSIIDMMSYGAIDRSRQRQKTAIRPTW